MTGQPANDQPPNGSVRVRRATPADYPAIARLTVAAYRADGQMTEGHPYESVLADVAGRAEHGELLVAETIRGEGELPAGAVVGTVLFVLPGSEYSEISQPGEAEFRMLAVDPVAQGRRIGEALVNACLDRAAELGCQAVVISTRDIAKAAQRLYQRMGFVRIPERDWAPLPGINLLALRHDLRQQADPHQQAEPHQQADRSERTVAGGATRSSLAGMESDRA